MGSRVLAFGGRDFDDKLLVDWALDWIHSEDQVSELVHGGAGGADSLAGAWARRHGVLERACQADWGDVDRPGAVVRRNRAGRLYDAAAGFHRNQTMLEAWLPDLAVGFPGGRGTADMAQRCESVGVNVWWPSWRDLDPAVLGPIFDRFPDAQVVSIRPKP
ncbi:DUF2493 domain-containing protein [Amorphus sp. MBR-141]